MTLKLLPLAALCAALGLLATGCPNTGLVCSAGLSACGNTACVDYQSDSRNCGGCGQACQTGQACVAAKCVCREGSSLCDGTCVVTDSDARNCGTCGNSCAGNQVCEGGTCKAACVLGSSSRCGGACVDLSSDPTHCGTCETSCPDNQSCHAGRCQYDLVAACQSVGTVVGLSASGNPGPARPMGAGPQALAVTGSGGLLVADGFDSKVRLASLPGLTELSAQAAAASPNHILLDPPYAYVVTSLGNTLLVLQQAASDAGTGALTKVTELDLGANTSPQAIAKVGTKLYIPLWGGSGAGVAAGQKVLTVDVSNPAAPVAGAAVDLTGVDLKPFDGGTAIPRPYHIANRNGQLYVPLNNLDPSYSPAGPGVLVRIDPSNGNTLTRIELPASCLNPGYLVPSPDAGTLYVSCTGAPAYDSSFKLLANTNAGVVALGPDDQVKGSWSVSCPANGDGGCAPPMPGRFAARGNRLYVGEASAGRVFVLEDTGAALVERRGYADGGTPVQACGVSAAGFGNVYDLAAIP